MNLRLLILLPLALSLSSCQQEKRYQWRLQSYAGASSLEYRQLVVMTDTIRAVSGGRLDIQPFAEKAITGGDDIYLAVKERRIEMGNGWPNWWSGQHPAWAVMNAGPYEFMNIDASLMFFLAGPGTELANELSKADGIIWRPAWWAGMEFGLLSRTPIHGLDDLKGKKVRIGPGLPSEVLAEASGAAAVPLVPSEIRTALEGGHIDAVEWTTPSGAWDLGLNDIAQYAIVPAIWQPAVLSDFLINEEAYQQLPEDLQTLLMHSIQAYTLTTTFLAKHQDIEALKKFTAQGTEISYWSAEDLTRWKEASDKIRTLYQQKDPFSARLLKAKMQFKAEYDGYYESFGPYH